MTVPQLSALEGEEEINCNGPETVILKPQEERKVRTAKEILEDLHGAQVDILKRNQRFALISFIIVNVLIILIGWRMIVSNNTSPQPLIPVTLPRSNVPDPIDVFDTPTSYRLVSALAFKTRC